MKIQETCTVDMSTLIPGAKSAGAKASRRLPDGAKELLQDFVVAVLR